MSPDVTDPVEEATRAAEVEAVAAARSAGVEVRPLSDLAELEAVTALYASIWRSETNPPVTTELLRAMSKAGSYVSGAFAGGELVGACIGFFAAPAEGALHSHIAGVSPTARLRNVAFAMKLHQRAWALGRGVSMVEWTYDPLVRRNAYFNLAKLAADPAEYLPNFYGGMGDEINGDDDSDRILIHWRLRDPVVVQACAGRARRVDAGDLRAAGAVVALGCSDGAPQGGRVAGDAAMHLVAVPADIEALRRSDPALARGWRLAVRETLTGLLGGGGRVTGFDQAGWYVVTR